ncbi:MAG: NHL repeat-containing protein [Bacteroidota bacterium]|jgi:sugar lactone lactonase YvrE|nr:NHL repeat-containing protein [Bacteroidota bacterium]
MKTHLTFIILFSVSISILLFACKKDKEDIQGQPIEQLAGTGEGGFADGPVATAQFNRPNGITIDASGNLYITDRDNEKVRKISIDGIVSTIAGTGENGFQDGPGETAKFREAGGIEFFNGELFVADWFNHRIRKIDYTNNVTTFAGRSSRGLVDGAALQARFNVPKDLVKDNAGNFYVVEQDNNAIRKISSDGMVTTLAGDGTQGFADGMGSAARFYRPRGIAIDKSGNLYVTDANNHSIRKITPSGNVTTLAGDGTSGFADGTGASAKFNSPKGIDVDNLNNIYVADHGNHRIRKISPTGVVTTFAGDGTKGSSKGRLSSPRALVIDAAGVFMYVADEGNHMIRKIAL